MFATGVRKICFLKRLINVPVYQDVLDYFLILCKGNNECIFQHDLASLHSAKSTKELFREKIPVLDSPAKYQMQIQ